MGKRGENDEMKRRGTNLEPAEQDKPDSDQPMSQDTMGRPATSHRPEARLGREVQARIGQQLRSMYDELVNEGVPQHIADLVRRLSEHD